MNETIDLEKIEQKTFGEFMIDGFTEILAGLLLILMPLFYSKSIFIVFLVFFVLFSHLGVEKIRERTTYPRIGRVEFKRDDEKADYSVKKSLLDFLLLLLATVLITFTVMYFVEGEILASHLWYKWVPLTFGLIMFGPSLYLVEKTGQRRYYLFGVFATILGFVFSIQTFSDVKVGMYLYFVVLGIFVLFFGISKYIWFIRNYPVILIEEE
ncbi:MAG: hypothetical protein ACFFCW_41050 [Candidatus Hodarchaeota archaeon]